MAYDLTATSPSTATYISSNLFGRQALASGAPSGPNPLPSTGVWTIDAWATTSTTTSTQLLLYSGSVLYLAVQGGVPSLTMNGQNYTNLTNPVADGVPHHYRVVSAGSLGMFFYVDGVLAATNTFSLAPGAPAATLDVGGSTAIGGRYWTGIIHEVAVWGIVRGTGNFMPASTAVDPTSADLIAYYGFDGTTANTSTGQPTSQVTDGTPGSLTLAGQVAFNFAGKFGASMISGTASTPYGFLSADGTGSPNVWLKTDRTSPGGATALAQANAYNIGLDSAGNATFNYGSSTGTVYFSDTVPLNDNAWHLLTMVLSATGALFFVDGHQVGSSATTPAAAGVITSGSTVTYVRRRAAANTEFIGEVDSPAIWADAHYSADFTPPTAPYQPGTSNLAAVWQLNGNGNINTGPLTGTGSGTISGGSAPTALAGNIAITTPFLVLSPNNWHRTTDYCETINSGAYMRLTFDGTDCKLYVDANALSASPYIRVIVDNGLPVDLRLASGAAYLIIATGLTAGLHDAEVSLDGRGDYNAQTWDRGQRLKITSIGVTGGNATLVAARAAKAGKSGLFFGDSLTEQHQVNGVSLNTSTNPNAGRFGASAWARTVATGMNIEWGQVGFGGMSWSQAGVGGVPAFPTSWSSYSNGFSRLGANGQFIDHVDYIWIMFGANPTSVTAAQRVSTLEAIRLAAPTAHIFLLITFGRQDITGTQAGAAAYQTAHPSDSLFHLVDMGMGAAQGLAGGAANVFSEDGLHPTREHNGVLAGYVLRGTQAALPNSVTTTIPTGNLPVGKSMFKFVATTADNLSNYAGLLRIWRLVDGGSWTSGSPTGPSFQAVKQFVPGGKYYVVNNSTAAIPLYGAQL